MLEFCFTQQMPTWYSHISPCWHSGTMRYETLLGAHSFWVAAGHTGWEPPFRIMTTDNPPQDKCSDQLFWLMFSGLNVHAVSPKWSHTPLGRLCTGWKGFLSHPNQHTSAAHTPMCTLYYVCTLYICSILLLNQCQKGWVYHLSFYHLIFAEGNDMLELILPRFSSKVSWFSASYWTIRIQ